MSDSTSQPTALTSTTGPLFTTVLAIIGLLAVLSFTSKLETYEFSASYCRTRAPYQLLSSRFWGISAYNPVPSGCTPLPKGEPLRMLPELCGS